MITPLGFTTAENLDNMKQGHSGIRIDGSIAVEPIPVSRIADEDLNAAFSEIGDPQHYTRLEKMLLLSVSRTIAASNVDPRDEKTLIIISSAKGNIDLLEQVEGSIPQDRIHLWKTAAVVKEFFQSTHTPVVVCNACISGVLAILNGSRLIQQGMYENVIVTGADIVSEFTPSGFLSFKAVSAEPCKPFDAKRDGITLGEGCGTVLLSAKENKTCYGTAITVNGGASSNDANHISGPSRTGEGLFIAINKTLAEAGMKAEEIDFISAHGTGTVYNDEMESIAMERCSLTDVPVNSLKGYFGHTLGAAGMLESIITIRSMSEHTLYKTLGYTENGVSGKINILAETKEAEINKTLKLASGFGGCNAAVVFSKK